MIARISDIYEPQFPVISHIPYPAARGAVVSRVTVQPMETVAHRSGTVQKYFRLSCSDSEESDTNLLSVGAVRPLAPAAPLSGAGFTEDCQLHVDSKDDVVSMGAWAPMDGPKMCCARLDDFDWVFPHYEPNMLLSWLDMEVGITDIERDIRVSRIG